MDLGFNPLSTGHARKNLNIAWSPEEGFNPLSTGHALYRNRKETQENKVSIPYLRVTHDIAPPMPSEETVVSIPYLRVTHPQDHLPVPDRREGFNPLSTGHARFRGLQHSSSVVGFNPLSTGHAQV